MMDLLLKIAKEGGKPYATESESSPSDLENWGRLNLIDWVSSISERFQATPPLEHFTAQNPLAQETDQDFFLVAARMEQEHGVDIFAPSTYFLNKIKDWPELPDAIRHHKEHPFATKDDLIKALQSEAPLKPHPLLPSERTDLTPHPAHLFKEHGCSALLNLLMQNNGGLVLDTKEGLFPAWTHFVRYDFSLDLSGFRALRHTLAKLSQDPLEPIARLYGAMDVGVGDFKKALYALGLRYLGYLGYTRFLDQEEGVTGEKSRSFGLFAIACAYEWALGTAYETKIAPLRPLPPLEPSLCLKAKAVCLEFFEQEKAQKVLQTLTSSPPIREEPRFQALFCIDPRSEALRRHLEGASREVETKGVAGFFGLALKAPSAFGKDSPRCPPLLKAQFFAKGQPDGVLARKGAVLLAKIGKRLETMFYYVESFGLFYGLLLLLQSFRPRLKEPPHQSLIEEALHFPLADQITWAKAFLSQTGLKGRMARLVFIAGHGGSSGNNAYKSALDCGACGGHPGDINALTACFVLNHKALRAELAGTEYEISKDTYFVPGFHNTTTGALRILSKASPPLSHQKDLSDLTELLKIASQEANKERAQRENRSLKGHSPDQEATHRGAFHGEIQPEWGLCGNHLFLSVKRERTRGHDWQNEAFISDYHPDLDRDQSTLEQILIAPLRVAQGINMQYFLSSARSPLFQAGSKLLHSPIAHQGVLLGYSYELKTGLPQQSIALGERLMHTPWRLSAFFEAKPHHVKEILKRHPEVARLIENRWLSLYVLDPDSTDRYLFYGEQHE